MNFFVQLLQRWRGLLTRDFYLAKAGFAAHFEKEWSDLLLPPEKINFNFAPFDKKHLSQSDTVTVAKTLLGHLKVNSDEPKSYLEIGPGLGRTFYEILKETPSLRRAQLIEPSAFLANGLKNLFSGEGTCAFPLIYGNEFISEVEVDPTLIRTAFKSLDLDIINSPFEKVTERLDSADLVLCLNVLDQCRDPRALLKLLREKTELNGFLVVSCTYLWQKKYPWSKGAPFKNLRSQFGEEWEVLSEEDLPFSIRINERFWYTFLSQVLYLRRRG